MRPKLGRLVVMPLASISVLAAVLVWEIEHVGSILLALALAAIGLGVGAIVARAARQQIDELSRHYEALLTMADDQSRRAETANRLKDEFLATLSHELRTPLNAILGWTRLVAGGKLDAPRRTKAIHAIERAAWAQARLVDDLLDISRIGAGTLQISPRRVTVQPIVDAALRSLRAAAEAKQIDLAVRVDPNIGAIAVDPDRLRQILWHLTSNAIKFTPACGHVDLAVASGDGCLRIVVEDTGIGMNEAVAAHLFERFRQGDGSSTRQYGGLGLGLSIVRHLVELHGGTVSARSAGPGRGAQFEIALPIRAGRAAVRATTAPAEQPPVLTGVTVLLVDDDPSALGFVQSALEQYGATVVTASSAREARERFTRQPPDVLVSDLRMPDEDGLALIREIREIDRASGRHTPAAALTALVRSDDRQHALAAGFELHVAKPVDPQELASTVERLVHH
jgi:signal transduction histidine kinase